MNGSYRRDIPLVASEHARRRARERFPGFKAARIVDEVRDAMVNGRFSAELPPWIDTTETHYALYAWTEDGDRVYPLRVDRVRTDGAQFVVTTVLRRGHTREENAT